MDRFQLGDISKTKAKHGTGSRKKATSACSASIHPRRRRKAPEGGPQPLQETAKALAPQRERYQELIDREGIDKARANIVRFYEDALNHSAQARAETCAPSTPSSALILLHPLAVYFYASQWTTIRGKRPQASPARPSPGYASDISYYRSRHVHVFI